MKLLDMLKKEAIVTDLKATDKMGVIEELITPIAQLTHTDQNTLVEGIMSRERLGSTGIGNGIGIPHGKLKGLPSLVMGVGLSRKGVDFESIDGKRTYIFFLLLAPEEAAGLHLKLLARISRLLKNDLFRQALINARNADEVYTVIQSSDEDF